MWWKIIYIMAWVVPFICGMGYRMLAEYELYINVWYFGIGYTVLTGIMYGWAYMIYRGIKFLNGTFVYLKEVEP